MPTSWLRLPAADEAPATLDVATHGCDSALVPPLTARTRVSPWLPSPDRLAGVRPDARMGGSDWYVGREFSGGWTPRTTVALKVSLGRPRVRRYELGPGAARAVAATDGHLWVAVHGSRLRLVRGPISVRRFDADTGEVQEVLGPDAVEITGRSRPLGSPPVDEEDYAALCEAQYGDLDRYWRDRAGESFPLADGMSGAGVEVVGTWPETRLEVSFAWDRRPGLRMRRTIPLYDDLGRLLDPEYADIQIMEDLDTGRVPPASYAVSGVLDF